ncbi:hypothetical protein [Desulforhopalus singaporensis]|uniref:Uncharacterized protein n=1 Tax=Desulforhopalus singaporensis TaxID=91360 RepID=A0A1H0UV41_9BACT|nr:hypothetical protein [Desulforhopalus singaporensis]SDP69778.1 hypothetical protein SAMN05660330_03723 [Desulforhopalus singaporensis]
MITINGAEFSKYLQVPDWLTSPGSAGSEHVTLGGSLIVQRFSGDYPKEITLTAKLEGNKLFGYFTTEQVEYLRLIADSGEPVPFEYHGRQMNIVIPLDGINLVAQGNRSDPPSGHPHYGTVTGRIV